MKPKPCIGCGKQAPRQASTNHGWHIVMIMGGGKPGVRVYRNCGCMAEKDFEERIKQAEFDLWLDTPTTAGCVNATERNTTMKWKTLIRIAWRLAMRRYRRWRCLRQWKRLALNWRLAIIEMGLDPESLIARGEL